MTLLDYIVSNLKNAGFFKNHPNKIIVPKNKDNKQQTLNVEIEGHGWLKIFTTPQEDKKFEIIRMEKIGWNNPPFNYFQKSINTRHIMFYLNCFLDLEGKGQEYWMYEVLKNTRFFADYSNREYCPYKCLTHRVVNGSTFFELEIPVFDDIVLCIFEVEMEERNVKIIVSDKDGTEFWRNESIFPSWNIATQIRRIMLEDDKFNNMLQSIDISYTEEEPVAPLV